jgi:hypothetical protein
VAQELIPLAQHRSMTPLQRSAAVATLQSILLRRGTPRLDRSSSMTGGTSFWSFPQSHFQPYPVAEALRPATRERVLAMFRVMARDTTEERWFRWTAGAILVGAGEKDERD